MKFVNPKARLVIVDGSAENVALQRTTAICVGAHPDDVEFMHWCPILQAVNSSTQWFAGVTVTQGSGSSRVGAYADYSDEQMVAVRQQEQTKAAVLGNYSFTAQLGYSSAELRGAERHMVCEDLVEILRETKPDAVYTHNLADRHDSHVAVAVTVVEALRQLLPEYCPKVFLGGEVWRSLDWLTGPDRQVFDVGQQDNLSRSLLGLYDSQITGGKRYDLASVGRRRANATYNDAYAADDSLMLELAMDMRPLLVDPKLEVADYVSSLIARFTEDVSSRLAKFTN